VHEVASEDDNVTGSLTVESSNGGGGGTNPFITGGSADSRDSVVQDIISWNSDKEIDGTQYTRDEIIGFIVEWNQAQ
jgi:hypothetical protein